MRRVSPNAGGKVPYGAPSYQLYSYMDYTIDEALNISAQHLIQPVPPCPMPFSAIVPVRSLPFRSYPTTQPAVPVRKPFLSIIPWQAIFKPSQ